MPYASVDDIRMYYEEAGEGEPLLLLHGALGAVGADVGTSWSALLPDLSSRYRAISVEHRGHSRTNNPAGCLSYQQIAADIAAFIEHLAIAPAHLAGFSDGATIGLALGMRWPELLRSLVCVGANYRIDDRLQEGLALFDAATIEREHPEFATELARRHDAHHHPGYWRELVRQVRDNVEAELHWTESDLSGIPLPTLLIAGESDFAVSANQMIEMRRAIPNAEMLILNHAGMNGMDNHRVHVTRSGIVGPVMLDFLNRQTVTVPSALSDQLTTIV